MKARIHVRARASETRNALGALGLCTETLLLIYGGHIALSIQFPEMRNAPARYPPYKRKPSRHCSGIKVAFLSYRARSPLVVTRRGERRQLTQRASNTL